MQSFNAEHLQEKWAPILDHEGMGDIKDNHRRMVTAVLLENQEKTLREEKEFLSEAAPTNSTGASIDNFDPVLISLSRRSMPNLVAYDLAGVQPMNGPTGLIFAMRSRYSTQDGTEAFYNEPDSAFSGTGADFASAAGGEGYVTGSDGLSVGIGTTNQQGSDPGALDGTFPQTGDATAYNVGEGNTTAFAEALGTDSSPAFNEMAFSIEKVTVTAKSRALKAEYSLELAQYLKANHGLNAEA